METIGTQRFNGLLVEWANEDKSSSRRFIDLYQRLLAEVPMSEKGNITQLFETTRLLP